MENPVVPAIIINAIRVTEETKKLWTKAATNVQQAQKAFLKAYNATLVDALGSDWKCRWKQDTRFHETIAVIEKEMQRLCREQDMPLTVFNRYRSAARKSVLLDVPFAMAKNLSVKEIKQAEVIASNNTEGSKEERIKEACQQIKEAKSIQRATSKVSTVATVLPLPEEEPEESYLEEVSDKLVGHIQSIKEKYGEEAAKKLLDKLVKATYGKAE